MPTKNSTKISLFLLSIIEILERFSFYGMRSLIVLFAVSENGLQLENEVAIDYYWQFNFYIGLAALPMGILSDFFFKQKNGVLLGGALLVIGYLCLMGATIFTTLLGLILIIIGTGFFNPNLTVLEGRLFKKEDKNRNLAFIIFYWVVNIGSFMGVLTVGYFGENYSWNYGFALCALAMIFAVILFYVSKDRLDLKELNETVTITTKDNYQSPILDNLFTSTTVMSSSKNYPIRNGLICFLAIIVGIYWVATSVIYDDFYGVFSNQDSFSIFNFNFRFYMLESISAGISLIVVVILLIYGYWKGLGSSLKLIGFGLLFVTIWGFSVDNINKIPTESLAYFAIATFFLSTIAEMFLIPIIKSYVTRLSHENYASTIIGFFITFPFVINKLMEWLQKNNEFEIQILAVSLIILSLTVFIFSFRKKIERSIGFK